MSFEHFKNSQDKQDPFTEDSTLVMNDLLYKKGNDYAAEFGELEHTLELPEKIDALYKELDSLYEKQHLPEVEQRIDDIRNELQEFEAEFEEKKERNYYSDENITHVRKKLQDLEQKIVILDDLRNTSTPPSSEENKTN